MTRFVQLQLGHTPKAALDVGCGPGYFTIDFLSKRYEKVDMFDNDSEEIFTA